MIIHKWYWAWDFEKEEAWLNQMAQKGLALKHVGFCTYTFEDAQPETYAIRLEMLDEMPGHEKSRDYIRFVEETGGEYVGSVMRWVYFRKKGGQGFQLYSDINSRIAHLDRIRTLLIVLMAAEFAIAFGNMGTAVSGVRLGIIFPLFLLGGLFGYGIWRINRVRRALLKKKLIEE